MKHSTIPQDVSSEVPNPQHSPTLKVSLIEYYGRETIKPECDLSRLFCKLLKQRTLTRENVETIKLLGYTFETIHKSI